MILINSSPKNALKIFQPFLPIFVPVGIGCLLGVAEKEGIRVHCVDEQIEDNILNLVAEYTKNLGKPYIFGFSVLTAAYKNAIHLSRELKKIYPDSIILFGGVHPSALPEEVLLNDHIDFVLRGEAERSIMELYRAVKNHKDFSNLNNISYRRNGQIIHNRISPIIEDVDSLPSFPYHKFTSKKYDLGFVLSSRGCPYRCIFCSNRITTGKKYRFRSAQHIVDELDILYNKYNKKFILFLDDNFCVSKERIYTLIDTIKSAGLDKKMTFNFQSRSDNVNFGLLQDLFNAGFRSIFFGIETSSEKIMQIIKKDETVKQCLDAVKMAKKIGYHVSATFIYGLPGENHQDRMNCVKLSSDLKLDMVRYNNATPYPGTELYEIARRENRLSVKGMYENFVSVSTFIENPFKRIPFSYVPQGNSEDIIRMDILFSYFRFYLDIGKLKNIFSRPDQGVGWFSAGERINEVLKRIPALIFLSSMLCFKFIQLFYYMVIKRQTRVTFREFLKVFEGLFTK